MVALKRSTPEVARDPESVTHLNPDDTLKIDLESINKRETKSCEFY